MEKKPLGGFVFLFFSNIQDIAHRNPEIICIRLKKSHECFSNMVAPFNSAEKVDQHGIFRFSLALLVSEIFRIYIESEHPV